MLQQPDVGLRGPGRYLRPAGWPSILLDDSAQVDSQGPVYSARTVWQQTHVDPTMTPKPINCVPRIPGAHLLRSLPNIAPPRERSLLISSQRPHLSENAWSLFRICSKRAPRPKVPKRNDRPPGIVRRAIRWVNPVCAHGTKRSLGFRKPPPLSGFSTRLRRSWTLWAATTVTSGYPRDE